MARREDQFRRVLDALCAFVGVLDVEGTVIEVNQAALSGAGLTAAEVVGRSFWDCRWWDFSTESQQLLRDSIARAARGERLRYDAVMRTACDSRRWMDLQLAPVHDGDGLVIRVVASATEITDRKLTERRLRTSEKRLRRAGRAARVGIWEWNTVTGSVYWSEETCELFGTSPGRPLTYAQWVRKIHPEDRERAILVTRQASDAALVDVEQAAYRDEYRVRRADGSVLWVESVGAFDRDDGELVARGVVRDVTGRRHAEQALRDSEEKLRFVAERAEVGYWLWDIDADCLEWSALCRRLFGVGEFEAMSYERFIAAVHPMDRDRVDGVMRGCLEGGGLADCDVEFRTQWPDGTVRWIHAKGSATFAGDRPVRMAGIALDITDRKQDEKLLAEQSALLETLTGKAPVGFAFVDKSHRYVRVNTTLARLNGLSAAAHIGRTVAEVVPTVWTRVEPLYRKALAGEPVANVEVAVDTLAIRGEARHWLVSYYPVRVGTRIVGVGTVVVDITAQKRTEALLKEADRRKDEFLALLAHELRNPLTPIRNAVQILSVKAMRDPETADMTRIMERQLGQMVRLIDDLLDLGRINHGKLALRRSLVKLEDVVQQALDASLPLLEHAQHRLTVSVPQEPLWIDGDPARLAQVFSNLLNNASKYTPGGGRIMLKLAAAEGAAVITVTDNGIGIAADRTHEVFEMFRQLGSAADQAQDGLGIGLTLSRSLVELHGGTIEVASEGAGKGSTFTVRLPMQAQALPREPGARAPRAAFSGRRILVADDNRDAAQSLAMLLRLLGNEVELAYDGAEAVRQARRWEPEVVLLDIRMPRMDGYQACRAIRSEARERPLLLIALSGYGQESDRGHSRESGFDAHLVKPVDMEQLAALLEPRGQSASQAVPPA